MSSTIEHFEQRLQHRAEQVIAKACQDNMTEAPTQRQLFDSVLSLYPLEPNDERWCALMGVLLYAID